MMEPRPDHEESTAALFVKRDDLPEPIHPPTGSALALLDSYLGSDHFQIR